MHGSTSSFIAAKSQRESGVNLNGKSPLNEKSPLIGKSQRDPSTHDGNENLNALTYSKVLLSVEQSGNIENLFGPVSPSERYRIYLKVKSSTRTSDALATRFIVRLVSQMHTSHKQRASHAPSSSHVSVFDLPPVRSGADRDYHGRLQHSRVPDTLWPPSDEGGHYLCTLPGARSSSPWYSA